MTRFINEFDSMFDDWTTEESIDVEVDSAAKYLAKDMMKYVSAKYPASGDDEIKETYYHLFDKALAMQQKLYMMFYAKSKLLIAKHDFEMTQNMNYPALYGLGKTAILFYLESIIIFARCALDTSATIYSDLLFDRRDDSFHSFSKRVIKSDNPSLKELKLYYSELASEKLSAFRLLCGEEKGRALRDIIIHQANINLVYSEYKENCEKEKLFILIKGVEPIDFDWFVEHFIGEVIRLIAHTTMLIEDFMTNEQR